MNQCKDWRLDLVEASLQRYERAIENEQKNVDDWKITLDSLRKSKDPVYADGSSSPIGIPNNIKDSIKFILWTIIWRRENVNLPPNKHSKFLKTKAQVDQSQGYRRKLEEAIEIISHVQF